MKRLLLAMILVRAIIPVNLPENTTKAEVADKLRDAARVAGCESPVVEMEGDREHFEIRVWCRDEAHRP